MARFTASPEHSARSRAAVTRRWAAASPEQRKEQGRIMQAGLLASYVAKARNLAILNGWTPDEAQLVESAKLLHKADIYAAQAKALESLKPAPGHHVHVPAPKGILDRAAAAVSAEPAMDLPDASVPHLSAGASVEAMEAWWTERKAALVAKIQVEYDATLAQMTAGVKGTVAQ